MSENNIELEEDNLVLETDIEKKPEIDTIEYNSQLELHLFFEQNFVATFD
jgi:hypothetical protein